MEDDTRRTERNRIFQQLKPICIELSQCALQINESFEKGNPSSSVALAQKVKTLLSALSNILEQECRDEQIFDAKLANYVFFPLGLIFRRSQNQPAYVIDSALKSLNFLLEFGWKQSITLDLAKQILPLLTLISGGIPGSVASIPEEVKIEAYSGIIFLFRDIENIFKGPELARDETLVPVLGQCIFLLTEDIKDGSSTDVQLKALKAVEAIWLTIKDRELLATFLPGTVSAVSRCLTPSVSNSRPRTVLVTGIKVLELVLTSILGDIWIRRLKTKNASEPRKTALDEDWLTATTGQIKLALANVIKLRKHEHALVRNALRSFCNKLLDECNDSLQDSGTMLVETSIALWEPEAAGSFYTGETKLQDLATIYPAIGDNIKTALYNWIAGLPRVMQSNDDTARSLALKNLSKGYQLASTILDESSVLDIALRDSLRDSVTALLDQSNAAHITETSIDSTDANALISANTTRSLAFQPVVLAHQSQRDTREQFISFLSCVGSQSFQVDMASDMLGYIQDGSVNSQLSAFWLTLNLVKSAESKDEDFDAFLTLSNSADKVDFIRDELYQRAVALFSESDSNDVDWRLQAVALETITYVASKVRNGFRSDLVDSLYPVVQLLASPNPQLREHAIISLDSIARYCGYDKTSDLIIQNADYMVNAISLKLNAFDVSPQAPQVLIMMIRLSGAKIIPYLDDVIGSIFAALDNFHGYTRLVEVLFSVLAEVVDEGTRSGRLQLTDGRQAPSHRKSAPTGPSIEDIAQMVERWKSKLKTQKDEDHEDFPRAPWKSAKELLDEHEAEPEDEETESDPPTDITKAPTPTKTYTLIRDIARLSQHYLTSSSPFLRHRLLDLISTASLALAHNEDMFLPLVNDLWPVLIPRLHDSEIHVVLTAAETLSALCRAAGDFMATRIRTAWREDIIKPLKSSRSNLAVAERSHRGIYDQRRQVWDALVGLVGTIMEYVRVEDSMFDEALEIVGVETLIQKPEAKRAFEVVNADAVWLTMYLGGHITIRETPNMDGFTFKTE